MKIKTALFTLLASATAFATEGGDLLTAASGTNLRDGNSLNAPVIRTVKANEVFYRMPADAENGFIKIKLTDGSYAWVFEKYAYRIIDAPQKTAKDNNKPQE
jgi:uncharacterized protein YgiM (DUF1202 family)